MNFKSVRKQVKFYFILVFITPVFLYSCQNKKELEGSRPNIIFILSDDLSYRDLSSYGQELYQTPNLDELAGNSVRFTQAYAAAPECAPSRGCLMTGLHTGHGPIRQNSSARGEDHLMDSDITIAEVLKDAGYVCGFTGKWGIGQPGTEGVPYKQGFDYAFGFYNQTRAHTYFPDYLWENEKRIEYAQNEGFDMGKLYYINELDPHPDSINKYDENGKIYLSELDDPYGGVYSEKEIENAAMKFLDENKDQPFFLYFATQIPHGPVIVDDFSSMMHLDDIPQMNREWAAMVIRLDDFVGELVKWLKDEGLYENTIIFFASDNGYAQCGYLGRGSGPDWPDDPWFKNKGPFTGGKFSVLEGGCRVPFFVSWPAKIEPAVISEPVWLPDFFPTAAELAGAGYNHEVDGISLLPALTGNLKDFKGHEYLYFSKRREQAVRMDGWKAFRKNPESPVKLYLVEEDTYGERDLSAFYPEVVNRIEKIMQNEHVDHEWYWNPDETADDFQRKRERAEKTGNMQTILRANGIDKLPWEK